MKKILSIILVFVLVLGLCACGASGSKDSGGSFSVGYGREQIMPSGNKIGLQGYGNAETRISNSFLDYLYATCVAIRDEAGTTILQYHLDLISTNETTYTIIVDAVSEATGLPKENIIISATHTHSAPAIGYDIPGMDAYRILLSEQSAKAAQTAIADLSPAEMSAGSVTLEGMNFVRHYIQESGEYVGSNFGDWSASPLKAHAGNGDPEMQILKFTRAAEDKKDILMMNWQAHPCFTDESGNGTNLSADFIGTCRSFVEAQTGCDFIYFTGSAGNQNPSSRLPGENPNGKGVNQMKQFGQKVCEFAFTAMENMEEIGGSGVSCKQDTLTYASNDYGLDRLEDAKKAVEMFDKDGNSTAATNYARTLGFTSVYECRGIVANASRPASYTMTLDVVRIGDLGFVAAPYEMFSDSAFQIREGSPFKYTVISSITNHYWNYFPTKDAYENGCYESFTAVFASGIAEATADKFVDMLKAV